MFNLISQVIAILYICIGFYFGYKIGKEQRLPKYRSIRKIIKDTKQEIKQEKEEEKIENEVSIMEQYMQNINNYPNNQKDIVEE